MHLHPVLKDVFVEVVVMVPQEPLIIFVVFSEEETVEHLLDVGCYHNMFLSEANETSQETVVQVWSCEENIT